MSTLVLTRPGVQQRGERRWSSTLPLGLAYLASVAREEGLQPAIVDGRVLGHRSIGETVEAVAAHRPRFVGLSAMTVDFPRAAGIAASLKSRDRAITTILGGPHANALPGESLREAPSVDYVLAGEAFHELSGLVRRLTRNEPTTGIPGLWRREGDHLQAPERPAFLEQREAENLPRPAWDLFPRSRQYPVITQFGCPFRCVFCSHNSTRSVRYRPVDAVLDELAWLDHEFEPTEVTFVDETFGLRAERTMQILEGLVRRELRRRITFTAQTRADCVSREMLALMKRAGFEQVEIGVESGDPSVLSRAEKGLELQVLRTAVAEARAAGLKVWLKFILGLPGETRHTIRSTIDLATSLSPDRLSVATIVPYPGSQVYRWALAGTHGYRLLSTDWSRFDKYLGECLEIDGLSARTLKRFQAQMYVEVYLRNGRIGELASMATRNAALCASYVTSMVRSQHAD